LVLVPALFALVFWFLLLFFVFCGLLLLFLAGVLPAFAAIHGEKSGF
jgi:hypothetical protein